MITSRSNFIDYKSILDNAYNGEAVLSIQCSEKDFKKTISLKSCGNGIIIFDEYGNFQGYVEFSVKRTMSFRIDAKIGLMLAGKYDVRVNYLMEYGEPHMYKFSLEMV